MATFDINKAANFSKIKAGGSIQSPIYKILAYIFYIVIVLAILVFAFTLVNSALRPAAKILFAGSGVGILYVFIFNFLKNFFTPTANIAFDNLAETLSPPVVEIFLGALKIAEESKFAVVEPVVLLAALEKNQDGRYMLSRAGFGIEKDLSAQIAQAAAQIPRSQNTGTVTFAPEITEIVEAARQNALKNNRGSVASGDILLGLIQKSDVFKKLMFEIKIDENDIKHVVEWHDMLNQYFELQKRPFWEKKGSVGGIGRDWSFGYTPTLNQFARNLNEQIELTGEVHVYGRSREVEEIERVLAKTGKNNVLLIGQHGIGKKTIVKGFVSRAVKGAVLPVLRYSQVFQVDTGALLSGSGGSGEIAARVTKIFNEAVRAGNIILFFDNFHALVSKEKGVGQVNISEVILPYLEGNVRVIGATTLEEYHKSIEASPGVAAAFEKVEVKEQTKEEVIEVLEEMVPFIESRDGIFWPYQSVREVVRVSDRYIHNKPFPEKAIEIVDEISVAVAKSGQKIVKIKGIDDYVSHKLEVPVAQAEKEEAKKLLDLEAFLHRRVIGQDEAIKAVANAMRRARSGIQAKNRPIGNFLFLGPTGVGKTETSKALAEAYFGSEKNMIRIDMSEFQEQSSVYRLIGSPPAAGAEGEKGQLTTAVMDNPFSLVLLDELEKAHRDILTLFLQVFDDGRLTDGTGHTVDFANTIIIATSNAGSEVIRQNVQKGNTGEPLKKLLLEYLQQKGIFRPEFLNRFDAVVTFHPLTQEQIVQVAQLMLKSLAERMAEKEITVQFTPAAVQKLAKAGFDPTYGARPMRRAIQDKVENILAQNMLAGKIQRGAMVVIDEKDVS